MEEGKNAEESAQFAAAVKRIEELRVRHLGALAEGDALLTTGLLVLISQVTSTVAEWMHPDGVKSEQKLISTLLLVRCYLAQVTQGYFDRGAVPIDAHLDFIEAAEDMVTIHLTEDQKRRKSALQIVAAVCRS